MLRQLALLISIFSGIAHATSVWNWSGVVGSSAVSGSVAFSTISNGLGGYDLQIDLTNTAAAQPPTTANVLTGVYFDVLVGGVAPGPLSMKSATATGGLLDATHQTTPDAATVNANICAPGAVGQAQNPGCSTTIAGGWQLAYDPAGIAGGAAAAQKYGVGTSGHGGAFNSNAGNANYGVAPAAGINVSLGDVSDMVPYTAQTVTIVISGLLTNNVTIANVESAYGTAPDGAFFAEQPEPGTWILMGTGVALLLSTRRRRNPTP